VPKAGHPAERLAALVQQMLLSLMSEVEGELDHAAIAMVVEGLLRVEVKRM